GRVAAWVARAPAIVESFHNDEPFLGDRSWRFRLRALARITTQHIAISDAVKTRLVRDVGLAADSVTVVRYGVPDERGTLDRDAARAQLGVGADERVVGFVGRLTQQKRVDVLVDAAPLLRDATCVLVGDGELRPDLEARAARLGAGVRFAGHVPDAPAVMRAFDVFCLPSDWEGLGLVLVEAMLRGVPVAGATSGAIPEVLDHGRAGALFPPRDPAALAGVVNELLDDPARRAEMSRAGRAFALAAFAPERMLAETLQVYGDALGRSRRSRS
ncbi:MAG TPA: glycosyltransferase family 4 protein, partial [Acidimicrobiales bacterium]